jgi:dTMP kinase
MIKFITFEGGEGSGKSTQAKLLHQAFVNAEIDSMLTREPGGTDSAEAIRNLLIHGESKFYPISELLLHNASRYEHARAKIIPALENNQIVICDRFVDSSMAYQGYGHKIGRKIPALLHNLLMEGLAPDLTFILDVSPEEGLRRAELNKQGNNYEKLGLEFHTRVRNGFHEIAKIAKERCIMVNSHDNIAVIHSKIIHHVNMLSGLNLKLVADI